MTASLLRRRQVARPAFVVLEWTTHWRIIEGRRYRDAVALNLAGERRLVSFPDGVAA